MEVVNNISNNYIRNNYRPISVRYTKTEWDAIEREIAKVKKSLPEYIITECSKLKHEPHFESEAITKKFYLPNHTMESFEQMEKTFNISGARLIRRSIIDPLTLPLLTSSYNIQHYNAH